MTQALDTLLIVFGLLTAICGVLRGASFSKADREKHPILKKLDGKKVFLFTFTALFLLLTAVTQGIRLIITPPSLVQTQGPGGQIFEKATLTGFEKEVEDALSEQRSQTTDYFKAAEHDFAARDYRAAISNYRKSNRVIPTMSSYLNLGISLYYLSEYDKADEAFTSGRQIAVKKRDKKLEAPLRSGLGNVYFRQGKLEEALKSHQDALAIDKEIGNQPGSGQ